MVPRSRAAVRAGAGERVVCIVASAAAATALAFFGERSALAIETKGLQDWVSEADRAVEQDIREALASAFPDDGIVGEEHPTTRGESGFTWVIDPIDGTTNFIAGTADWCVVLAGIAAGRPVLAHVHAPVLGERFAARRDHGATLDGNPIRVSESGSLASGSVGVGHSMRVPAQATLALLAALLEADGMFVRSGSGALDLARVAAGRLVGYCEPHMNAWDCLASILLIEEAGGRVRPFDTSAMLERGGRVVAAAPAVYGSLVSLADAAYGETGE